MQIYIGSDHAGYELKETLKKYVASLGYAFEDKGAHEYEEFDDYPDFIHPVARAVAENADSFGIVLGGSGQGEAICANKTAGVRAALFYGGNMDIVKLAREHNNANVLSLGARFVGEQEAMDAVKLFLETPFSSEERHARRIAKI